MIKVGFSFISQGTQKLHDSINLKYESLITVDCTCEEILVVLS